MEVIFGILFGLAIPTLIVVGVIYAILRMRSSTPIRISYRTILRAYFYIVILVSIGLAGGGISTLVKVGFGEAFGAAFSYGSIYQEHRWEQEEEHRRQLEARNPDYPPSDTSNEPRSLEEKLDIAMKSSLINGVSLAIIGLVLVAIHLVGRRWVETSEEKSDTQRKLYLIGGLAVFAVLTIVTLAMGLPEALRYALLDINAGQDSPGEPLSVAVVALPVWLYYLVATLRAIRTNLGEQKTS